MKLILFCIVLAALRYSHAKLIGSAVIPHGDFVYDPSLVHYENGSAQLHEAATKVGKMITSLNPDIILLSTPHGMALTRDFLFYQNTNGSGYALLGQDLHDPKFPEYKVYLKAKLSPNITTSLVTSLTSRHTNVSGISAWADSEAQPLRWGEVIPLTFVRSLLEKDTRLIVISQPQRRYTEQVAMIPELLQLGIVLYL